MRILALDAATEACSVALLSSEASPGDASPEGSVQLIERYQELGKTHTRQLLSLVDSVLAEANVELCQLDGIAASVGPGAFTGVRISVAVAQGLAFGAGLRVLPVLTLEALALQAVMQGAARVLVCLDARMGEVYWGCFAADTVRGVSAISPPRVGPPDGVALPQQVDCVLGVDSDRYRAIGRGLSAYPALAGLPGVTVSPGDARALPRAGFMARLGGWRLAAGEAIDPAELSPLYLRDKVAQTEAERRQATSQ